jgi:hypothetical protein
VNAALKPGRYVVLGGSGGYTAMPRVMRDTGNGKALDNGREYVRTATYTDKWQRLAAFKVRPGQQVTHYGVLDAVMRVWELS